MNAEMRQMKSSSGRPQECGVLVIVMSGAARVSPEVEQWHLPPSGGESGPEPEMYLSPPTPRHARRHTPRGGRKHQQ